jgi:hypothetical protein
MTMDMTPIAIPPIDTLDDARRQLNDQRRHKPAELKTLAAAAILALSTLLLAGSVILGPFWQTKDAPAARALDGR